MTWEGRLLAVVTAVLVVFGLAAVYGASSLVTTDIWTERFKDIEARLQQRVVGQKNAIDAVARQAGVARMTVYYQFESKKGLLEALLDDTHDVGLM